jgi:hypothetical protein
MQIAGLVARRIQDDLLARLLELFDVIDVIGDTVAGLVWSS